MLCVELQGTRYSLAQRRRPTPDRHSSCRLARQEIARLISAGHTNRRWLPCWRSACGLWIRTFAGSSPRWACVLAARWSLSSPSMAFWDRRIRDDEAVVPQATGGQYSMSRHLKQTRRPNRVIPIKHQFWWLDCANHGIHASHPSLLTLLAPVRRPPPDASSRQRPAVAGTHTLRPAGLDKLACVRAAALQGRADGGAELAPEPIELGRRQTRHGAKRGYASAPQSLVCQQVADSGDRSLMQQPGFDRHAPATDPAAKLVAADEGGVGTDVSIVGVQHRPPQPPAIAEHEPASVGELNGKAIRAQALGRIEHDRARHSEVQPQCRAIRGLEPQEFPRRWRRQSGRPIGRRRSRPGGCGRQTYVSRSSTDTISRSSTASSVRRARSASGSSGTRERLRGRGDH